MSTPIQRPDSAGDLPPSPEAKKVEVEAPKETLLPLVPVEVRDANVTIVPTDLDQLEREIAAAAKQTRPPPSAEVPPAKEAFRLSPADLAQLEHDIAAEQARIAGILKRRLKPEVLPPPPSRKRPGDFAMIVRSAVVIGLASLAIPAALGAFPKLGELKSAAVDQISHLAAPAPQTLPSMPRPAERPRLVVNEPFASPDRETLLGIKVEGHGDGAVVILSDYAPGTLFSVGDSWGDANWLIPVAELVGARVRAPTSFAGPMQLVAALRLIDGSLADRKSIRIDWPAVSASIAPPTAAAPVARPNIAPRRLDAEEIALLLKRGQELLENGDIAGARLALQRAAEAEDARAALALAATYDPNWLRQLRVYGSTPDADKARAWYQKAIALGSREAPQRLELLVSESR